MRRRIAIAVLGSALALTAGASSALAQATGTPGEPNCHGQRVSFGSSEFDITPKDRAGILGISVQQFQQRVRASCQAP
jgi:hypothetical protein